MPPRRTGPKTSTTLPRRQLGRALRDARQKLGQTLEQAADAMQQVGRSTLNRLELGEVEKPKPYLIEFICKYYGLPDDEVESLKLLASEANTKYWWQGARDFIAKGFETYMGLEASAESIYVYQSLIIPGLLQTDEYARALAAAPFAALESEEAVERRVALRVRRSAILTRQYRPITVEFLIHESVLHTIVGSPSIMSRSLRHMADLSTRDNVSIRILPSGAGFPAAGPHNPYILLDFPGHPRGNTEPSVVYTETTVGTMFFEDDDDLKSFREIHEVIRNASYEEQKSRDLLRQIAARRYKQ